MKERPLQTNEKILIFQRVFTGLTNVYGTYDVKTSSVRQVKKPVTSEVILNHFLGRQPYGLYLLTGDTTRAAVVDFDTQDRFLPIEFINNSKHYSLPAYLERSKSKGYHVWIFFKPPVPANKARIVVQMILDEINAPETEIFPKQNRLSKNCQFGNFINTPFFGPLVAKGRTVFIDPHTFKPYPNQWDLLKSIQFVTESNLDAIIEINDLDKKATDTSYKKPNIKQQQYYLPPCARKMLIKGVSDYQRVSCFRLAVHLKRVGIPIDFAITVLKSWALKNIPSPEKSTISEREIISQTSYAYGHSYTGYGCGGPAIEPFCAPECALSRKISQRNK